MRLLTLLISSFGLMVFFLMSNGYAETLTTVTTTTTTTKVHKHHAQHTKHHHKQTHKKKYGGLSTYCNDGCCLRKINYHCANDFSYKRGKNSASVEICILDPAIN